MNQNYAIIDNITNIVINIVLWDGDTSVWQPPEGTFAIQTDVAGPGWIYDPATGTFTNPKPRPEPIPDPIADPVPTVDPEPIPVEDPAPTTDTPTE